MSIKPDVLVLKPVPHKVKIFVVRVRRKTFGPKTYEVRGEWGRLHNEKLRDLYSSQKFRVIGTRKVRWAGHVKNEMGGACDTYGEDDSYIQRFRGKT